MCIRDRLGNLRAFVQRLTGGLPLDVVATHGHVDHIGGRGQFPRVSVQKEDVGIIGRVTVPYRKAFFALQRQAAPYAVSYTHLDVYKRQMDGLCYTRILII